MREEGRTKVKKWPISTHDIYVRFEMFYWERVPSVWSVPTGDLDMNGKFKFAWTEFFQMLPPFLQIMEWINTVRNWGMGKGRIFCRQFLRLYAGQWHGGVTWLFSLFSELDEKYSTYTGVWFFSFHKTATGFLTWILKNWDQTKPCDIFRIENRTGWCGMCVFATSFLYYVDSWI